MQYKSGLPKVAWCRLPPVTLSAWRPLRRLKKRATFPLATIPGQHLRVRHFTIIFSGRRNVRAVRFE
jgi:hypothetical protein